MPDLTRGWLLGLGMLLLLGGCAAPEPTTAHFQPSRLTLPLPGQDFAGYVTAAKSVIAKANQKVDQSFDPMALGERGPFELVPKSRKCRTAKRGQFAKGVLLVHGLGASPYQMRDLGSRFARACYLVRAVLLPGHGTVPGDLTTVDLESWRAATRAGIESFADTADQLVIAGFGLGASLALDHVLNGQPTEQPQLAGLVLLAPDLPAPTSRFGLGGIRELMSRRGSWNTLHAEDDPAAYLSLAESALEQRRNLLAGLRPAAPMTVPVFMAVSADDATIDPDAARSWFCSHLAGPRALLWYDQAPTAGAATCPAITERQLEGSPDILDLAHPALPIAPGNTHYGRNGDYLSCAHYDQEQSTPAWFICADRSTIHGVSVRYGEINDANLDRYVMRRLTWNPDFDGLTTRMLAFLDDLS